jgi:bifunctional UDP-N-acetylglucosamine pyrophosphorylase/glucosamine-1-phosphate N-acetyltransferase
MSNLAGVILAAGKGTRMKSKDSNKVTVMLAGKPMVLYALDHLKNLNVDPIVIVVGFAKDSVKNLVKENVIFAEQEKRLGTAHAVKVAIKQIPSGIENVIVIQGDDSAFYKKELFELLTKTHLTNHNALTFLTVEMDNPTGLGRVIRNKDGLVERIVEEKNATHEEKNINEINPACYVFSINFLKKYLSKVKKNEISGEYYLVDLIEIALKNNEKIEAVKGGKMTWRGVNTREELQEAEKLYLKTSY